MLSISQKQAIRIYWRTFTNTKIQTSVALFPEIPARCKASQPAPILYQRLGWLTGSTLLLLVASSSPVAAQTVLFRETFTNPTVGQPGGFIYGVGLNSADPPCLTAAPLQAAPPPQGTGQGIPGCITTTTNLPQPDPAKTGALRLTPSKDNQASFVLIDNPIPSDQGLVVTFDFFTYNGNGADGMSFFLIDGTVSPRQAGGFGGSLGYAQRTAEPPERPEDVPGIDGGYVGIGFDEFGGFANPQEGRVGGPGQRPDSVAIRGRSGPFATGYRYLIGTGDAGATPLPGSIDNPGATVRNAARRIARITLTPENQISVDINFGGGFVNVIPPYDLNAAPGQGTLPRTFKFGFASATGGSKNIHEIRNLLITSLAPDLRITKTGPESFSVGKQASYTLRVRNSRSGGPTTGRITVTDTLPPGFRFISATGRNWSCSAQGSKVTCNYADAALPLRSGAVAPPIRITALPTAAAGTKARNTANVSTPGDTNPGNNTSTINTRVVKPPRCNPVTNICQP